MRPPVHIPEPAMMMHVPRMALSALDASAVRTSSMRLRALTSGWLDSVRRVGSSMKAGYLA